jgi:uncharacterized membrane protein YeaQ/YmgE (transglycosylase-associated protein family)
MIGALILGLAAGFIARALVPGDTVTGILKTMLIGLGGSLVGWVIFTKGFGIGDSQIFDLGGIVGAVIGAVLVLVGYTFWEQRTSR